MKIIIVGCGKVGTALTAQLSREDNLVTVIDTDSIVVRNVSNTYDVMGIVGNGASYQVLQEADIEHADLMIAVTKSDEMNLLCCVIAKQAADCHTIARVRNPMYREEREFIRKKLGLSMIINPEKATAREIARVLRFPTAIKREQFCRQRFELIEYRLADDNPLVGLQLSELYRNIRVKILICAVARGSETIIPTGSTTLQAGDKIYLTASACDLESFFRKLNLFKAKANNVMIVGASRVRMKSAAWC